MTGRGRPGMAARLLAAVLVTWAVAGWSWTVLEHVRRPLRDPPRAALWHLRPYGPRVSQLRGFLADVDAALPASATVAVALPVPPQDPGEHLFRYLWAAYLLPRHLVVPAYRADAARSQYWVSYLDAGDPPADAVEIARWPHGRLYRLRRAANAKAGADPEPATP